MIISDYFQIINRKRTKRHRTTPSNMVGRWSRSELWYAIWHLCVCVWRRKENQKRKQRNIVSAIYLLEMARDMEKSHTFAPQYSCDAVSRAAGIRYFVLMRRAKRRGRGRTTIWCIYLHVGCRHCGMWGYAACDVSVWKIVWAVGCAKKQNHRFVGKPFLSGECRMGKNGAPKRNISRKSKHCTEIHLLAADDFYFFHPIRVANGRWRNA